MRRAVETQAGRLLRVLFLWIGALPAGSSLTERARWRLRPTRRAMRLMKAAQSRRAPI